MEILLQFGSTRLPPSVASTINIVGQSKNRYEVTIKIDQQIYVLRLTSVGSK